jgi:glycosyltransferase involved in cell wall biosynthesis
MNVLIDATCIRKNKAGVGVYAKNLIHELAENYPNLSLFLLTQDDDPDLDYSGWPNVKMIRVPARVFRILPFRFLLEQIGVPLLLLRYRIKVLHSLHYSFPLVGVGSRQVVTVHDMTSFDMPEVHIPLKRMYFRFFIRASVRLADAIIFVSRSAQEDYISRFGPPRGSTFVIHHGKNAAFRPDLDPDTVRRVRDKYGLPPEFILYIGTIEPRKNLARLVAAFAPVSKDNPCLSLVLAGEKGWMYDDLFESIRKLGLGSRIVFPGYIDEEDKPFLLAGAKLFVYPSLYEGFGLPVLEALACGVATVTSNVSSIPEVAGQAALLVEPTQVAAITDAITKLLSDTSLRQELQRESIKQAAKFNWQATAKLTVETYIDR